MRRDLRGLSKEGADWVAAYLVAAGALADEEPELAWHHARAARARGGRIGVVRETVGLVAYRAGEWAEAIGELRAARRMGGGPGHLAVMADCERALGHPERAIELSRSTEADALDPEAAIELQIVVAGARADLGQVDAALAQIQRLGLDKVETHARLAYAYADLLLKAGRRDEAVGWFIRSANADLEEETDALERLDELGAEEHDGRGLEPAAGTADGQGAAPVHQAADHGPSRDARTGDERGRAVDAGAEGETGLLATAGPDRGHGAAVVADADDADPSRLAGPADDRDRTVDPEPTDVNPATAPGFIDTETSPVDPAAAARLPAGPPAPIHAPNDTADDRPAENGSAENGSAENGSAETHPLAAGEPVGEGHTPADGTDRAPAIVPTILFSDDPQTGDR